MSCSSLAPAYSFHEPSFDDPGSETAFWQDARTGAGRAEPSLQPHDDQASVATTLVLLLIVLSATVRLVLAASTGLGVDESYMVAAGRHPQLGYFDHPPLGWWLAWGGAHLFGTEAPFAVRLPFVLLFGASTWLMHHLTATLFRPRAGFWAALAFNLSPVLGLSPVFGVTTATWVLPDGPLVASLLGCVACVAHASRTTGLAARAWFVGAGVCGGLAMLSKYTAVLVLAGLVLAMASHPRQRHRLRQSGPWLAVLVAGASCLPVVVWNDLPPQLRARDLIGPGRPAIAGLSWHVAGKRDDALGGAATAGSFSRIEPLPTFWRRRPGGETVWLPGYLGHSFTVAMSGVTHPGTTDAYPTSGRYTRSLRSPASQPERHP